MKTTLVILLCVGIALATILLRGGRNQAHAPADDLIEQRVVIDDAVIDGGDPFAVIDPVWWEGNIYDGYAEYEDSLRPFSKEQRHVYAIVWYSSEVNNGGHDQFFFNSTGIVWKDALEGFKAIGAAENHSILMEAADVLGGSPSFDREERWKQLGDDDEDHFSALDDRFYASEAELTEALITYIRENRQRFYFDGTVKKPKDFP